eukprot:SAG22_NODE_5901_length_934_cov_1.283832_1_plen_133_part_00
MVYNMGLLLGCMTLCTWIRHSARFEISVTWQRQRRSHGQHDNHNLSRMTAPEERNTGKGSEMRAFDRCLTGPSSRPGAPSSSDRTSSDQAAQPAAQGQTKQTARKDAVLEIETAEAQQRGSACLRTCAALEL